MDGTVQKEQKEWQPKREAGTSRTALNQNNGGEDVMLLELG
jgi:hypothetical protein